MRFGLFIPQGWRLDLVDIPTENHWSVMHDLAAHADASPWDSLWVYDHFHTVPVPTDEATHEAWTLMAAYAATTSRIKLGQMCTAMSYRNPVYLAKIAATTDIISGGRVQMGIGGGWYEHEWRAYGYGFPDAGERLRILEDALEVVARLRGPGPATWQGHRARLEGAFCVPAGVQRRIPVVVGGNGQRVTWRLAARHADELNLDAPTVEQVAAWLPVVRQRCEEIGRDPATLRVSAQVWWERGGPERVETLGRLAELGLARIHSDLPGAPESDEPLHRFAEDCRAAGVTLTPGTETETEAS